MTFFFSITVHFSFTSLLAILWKNLVFNQVNSKSILGCGVWWPCKGMYSINQSTHKALVNLFYAFIRLHSSFGNDKKLKSIHNLSWQCVVLYMWTGWMICGVIDVLPPLLSVRGKTIPGTSPLWKLQAKSDPVLWH